MTEPLTPQDRLTKAIESDLARLKEESLSEDPDKVVSLYSPLDEERAMKGFNYYMQRIEGRTSLWNQMVTELRPNGRKQITGVIFDDDSVVWSDEAVNHNHLVVASKKDQSGKVGQFQTWYHERGTRPDLSIYSDDNEAIDKFADYLRRNLAPNTDLSVWANPIKLNNSPVKKHQILLK